MATYKQKPYRVQTRHVSSDSEEASVSEQEWVVYGTRAKKRTMARDLTSPPPKISDDEWHVLSDTASPGEENISIFENISSVGSGFDSEADLIHDENLQLSQRSSSPRYESNLIGLLPSHDGVGNFSDPSNSTLAFIDSSLKATPTFLTRQQREKLFATVPEFDSEENTFLIGNPNPISLHIQEHEVVDKVAPKNAVTSKNHKGADSASNVSSEISSEQPSTNHNRPQLLAKLFNLSSSDVSQTNIRSTSMPRIGLLQSDPMSINFSPTISKENFTGVINNEHGQAGSDVPRRSLFSTVWTSFRKLTSHIINADAEVYNDLPQNTAKSPTHHFSGLAAIINGTGENQYTYDSCHLPFGSYLTLTDLGCFPRGEREIWSSRHYTSLKHQNSSPSYYQTRSSAAEKTVLTPVSSSTSLKSFASRDGSDCGLETDLQYREADCVRRTRVCVK